MKKLKFNDSYPFLFIFLIGCKAVPQGNSPAEADALARKIMVATQQEAWNETGAVSWSFFGRQHLWDRKRNLVRVCWKDYMVLVDIGTKEGVVLKDCQLVEGNERKALINKAWHSWANDSFWLNPLAKLFDEGTQRKVVTRKDGSEALLVTYTSGGATPGDSYLWIVDEDYLPKAWRLWVQILPLKGVKASWDKWVTTETGAKIATSHRALFLTIKIKGLKTAFTLEALTGGEDPFSVMIN